MVYWSGEQESELDLKQFYNECFMPRLKEFVLGYNHQEAPNVTPLFGKKRSLIHILKSPLKQHIPSHEHRSEIRVGFE